MIEKQKQSRHRLTVSILILIVVAACASVFGSFGSFGPFTSATTQAQTDQRCFPETNFCISGAIRSYWEEEGGLAVFGYPITPLRIETIDGWRGQVQWFERDRLEDHGSEGVMAGRLGVDLLALRGRPWTEYDQVFRTQAGCVYMDATKHSICEPFLSYWLDNGGVERLGYPITEPITEELSDGDAVRWKGTVQYFERRRMEHHTELQGSPVLLGLLGQEVLDLRTSPPTPPAPTATSTPPFQQKTPTPNVSACADSVLPALRDAYEQVTFRRSLGCPILTPSEYIEAATQQMEHGVMIWFDRGTSSSLGEAEGRHIYAVITPGPTFKPYRDTWDAYDDPYELEDVSPPSGRYAPRGGFGKVWKEDPVLREEIGWAIERAEEEQRASVQSFSGGLMLLLHDSDTVYAFGEADSPEDVQIIRQH